MDQKRFKVTNSGHGTIYCNSMLLFAKTSTLENDVLVKFQMKEKLPDNKTKARK